MSKTDTSPTKISDFLERGVREIITPEDTRRRLTSGQVLRVKHGVDPSGQDLHLGHASAYLKLRDLQEMGHRIVFLIGGFTGRWGDPTEELKTRALRSKQETEAASQNYINQISKILNIKDLEIRTNSEWYDKMSAEELLRLMSHFTLGQVEERDMFRERKKKGLPTQLHETIYPILQGYDSVMLKSDLTVIGTDQIFNENFGRDLQKKHGQEPQSIVAIDLLVGLDGSRKMGKSLNNYISINEKPKEQFGKIMSLPDELIIDYFTLATRVPLTEVKEMSQALAQKQANPRDLKLRLAEEIVTFYHSPAEAKVARKNFINTFSKKNAPTDPEIVKIGRSETSLLDLVVKSGLAASKSEARRLVEDGAVDVDGVAVKSPSEIVKIKPEGIILKVGKHRFVKVIG